MRDHGGKCGEEFGSNCEEDVSCPECEARHLMSMDWARRRA